MPVARQRKSKVVLPSSERLVSPVSYFVRTGKFPLGTSPSAQKRIVAKGKKLGSRFLSVTWMQEHNKRNDAKYPLPNQRARISGAKLPSADLKPIQEQISFAVNAFAGHLSPEKKRAISKIVKNKITGKNVNIKALLTDPDIKKAYAEGKEFYTFLKEEGRSYRGLMDDITGKTYFAQGWSNDRRALTTPIHETIHLLQQTGVIKIDVPFAQAGDRLYGLQKGIFKPEKRLTNVSNEELNRKPSIQRKEAEKIVYKEPNWAYPVGSKIGQWIFENLEPAKQWPYLIARCNGESHETACKKVNYVPRNIASAMSQRRLRPAA